MKNFPSPPPPPPEEEEEVNGRRGSFLFFRAKYLRKICRWKKKGAGTITCGEKGESWWRSFSENSELLRKETGGGGNFRGEIGKKEGGMRGGGEERSVCGWHATSLDHFLQLPFSCHSPREVVDFSIIRDDGDGKTRVEHLPFA